MIRVHVNFDSPAYYEIYHELMTAYAKFVLGHFFNNLRDTIKPFPELKHILKNLDLLYFFNKANHKHVDRLFSLYDETEVEALAQHFQSFIDNGHPKLTEDEKIDTLRFFLHNGSADLFSHLESLGLSDEEIQTFFNDPFFESLLELLMKYPEIFSFEIALLLNVKPIEARAQFEKELNPQKTRARVGFKTYHDAWYLCSTSEARMMKAIDEEGILEIKNNKGETVIIIKFNGKFAGLVVSSFATKKGDIIPRGLWVSPVSPQLKTILRKAYELGFNTLPLGMLSGEFAYMRAFEPESSEAKEPDILFEQILEKLREKKKNQVRMPFLSKFMKRIMYGFSNAESH